MARRKQKGGARSPSDFDRQIGALIRDRRLELGLAQQQLAAVIGVTFQQVQKYEKGVNRVAAATLVRIADALDTDIHALLPNLAKPKLAANGFDHPAVARAARAFSQLNPQGRRIVMDLLRSLGGDEMMKR